MKNLMKRIISTALSVCMLITMFSMLGTVAFAADSEYDSGNMPKAFFEPSFWGVDEDSTAAYKLADGSIKFTNTFTKEIGSYENDGFEVMFKNAGGFEIFFRANEDASEGYVLGLQAPRFGGTSSNHNFYIRKANSGSWLAQTTSKINGYNYNTWCKLGVRFIDKNGSTEIEFKINDVKLNFYFGADSSNEGYKETFKNIAIRNGNFTDYAAYSSSNSYMRLRPYYNGGFESSPNRDNQFYFASIDDEGKVLGSDQFVTRIAVVGDSITQGVGASNGRKTSYVANLQKMLGPNYDVYNCGASACTAMNATFKPYTGQVIYYTAQLFNPDYLIFALGSNDGQAAYWDKYYYYGPATNSTSNSWRSVAVTEDEDGNPVSSEILDSDGTTVVGTITVEGDVVTYNFNDQNGVAREYVLYHSAEARFIDEANNIINSFINNPYWGTTDTKVIISSVLETWAGIKNDWNRQQEAFEAQQKLAEQNENVIALVDNRSLFTQYNEDTASDMYYGKVSDDALHPNDAGHKLLAENVYNVIKDIDMTTEPIDIAYTSYGKANTDVAVRELNGGAVTTVTPDYFSVSGKNADSSYTVADIASGSTSTLNILNLGYKFDATFGTAFKWGTNIGSYDSTITDYSSKKHIIYSFGDLQLRSWRVLGTNNSLSYVYGLYYNNVQIGDLKYVEGTVTSTSSTMGEKLTYHLSYDNGNVTVTKQMIYQSNYSNIETADTSAADVIELFSVTEADILAATGEEMLTPINNIRFSASAYDVRGAMLTDVQITSDNPVISYNIQTTEGGSIYADGAIFDNTATRCVGDEVTLKAVINDEINYRFNSWQDSEGNVLSTDTEYYVAFVGGEDIIAVFDKIHYCDYAISGTEGGSILMDGEAFVDGTLYEVGYEHTITAVADEGYTFAGWINENEDVVTFSNDYTFRIPAAITLKAVFVPTVAANSLTVNATGGGSVDYAEADTYIVGSYLTLKARGSKYYKFIGWFDETDTLLSTKSTYNYIIKADNNLTAKFEFVVESDFSVTASGGTVTVDGAELDTTKTYYAGDIYTLAATANDGYTFAYWKVNDKIASYDATYSIRLEATAKVEAVFTSDAATDNVTVTFTNRADVIVSSVTVTAGSEVTLPDFPVSFGYTVEGWDVNGTVMQAGDKITADAVMFFSA